MPCATVVTCQFIIYSHHVSFSYFNYRCQLRGVQPVDLYYRRFLFHEKSKLYLLVTDSMYRERKKKTEKSSKKKKKKQNNEINQQKQARLARCFTDVKPSLSRCTLQSNRQTNLFVTCSSHFSIRKHFTFASSSQIKEKKKKRKERKT